MQLFYSLTQLILPCHGRRWSKAVVDKEDERNKQEHTPIATLQFKSLQAERPIATGMTSKVFYMCYSGYVVTL